MGTTSAGKDLACEEPLKEDGVCIGNDEVIAPSVNEITDNNDSCVEPASDQEQGERTDKPSDEAIKARSEAASGQSLSESVEKVEKRGAEAVDKIVDAITQVCSTQVLLKEGEVSISGKEAGTMNRIERKKKKKKPPRKGGEKKKKKKKKKKS